MTLEQFVAFNDEVASLVRAGVPLELGLKQFGEEQRDRLGRVSMTVAGRMSRGQTLSEALAAEGDQFPRLYRLLVEAGLRTGRLTVALEALSGFATELVDLRRKLGRALLYPLIVLLLAYGLFLVFVLELAGRFRGLYETFRLPVRGPLHGLTVLAETAAWWAWVLPVLVLLAVIWWFSTGGARLLELRGSNRALGWIPGVRPIAVNHRLADFSTLTALLVEQEVPLTEALLLAGEAAGDEALGNAAREMADDLSQGDAGRERISAATGIPPFLRWLLVHGRESGGLARALHLAAELYRRRAVTGMAWLQFGFPIAVGVVIGGGATLVYALSLFIPLKDLLQDLGLAPL